jgi:cell division protein FtsB
MNEKHMAEIATLESEIKMVRARNERLEREVKEMESLAYGNMGGKGCMK